MPRLLLSTTNIVVACAAARAVAGFDTSNTTATQVNASSLACVTGFVMDRKCIDIGFLLDAPSFHTLKAPEEHTVHCLVDVPICINSGFELLSLGKDPGSGEHKRVVRLDHPDGTRLVADFAKNGTVQKGLKVTIIGEVNHGASEASPPGMKVIQVLPSGSIDCE